MKNGCWTLGIIFTLLSGAAGQAKELWTTATGGDIWDLAPTDDLDGDGKKDLLAGAADNTVRALSSASGRVLWSYPAGGDVWCIASFPDLDGDQKREAVAGTGGNELLVISSTGNLLWSFMAGGDVWCVAEVGDQSGDGFPELACGSGDNQIHDLDLKNKARRWSRDLGGDVWSLAGGRDLDGDGVPDLVAGTGSNKVVAVNGVTGAVYWEQATTGDVWRVILAGDVNGDSVPDVVAGTGDDRALCLSGKLPDHGAPPFLWQARAGSDVKVLLEAPDYDGDGVREVLAGSLDNALRLLKGKTGQELWKVDADGALKDALVAPDINGDGVLDVFYCTDGSTVNAVSGSSKEPLWTHHAETDATFWSLAPLPDIDGDALADLAAGSALNTIVGLTALPVFPPDPVNDLACVAAQTESGPGVLLTWKEAPLTTSVRVLEVTGGVQALLGEVPAGVGRLLSPLGGSADPRTFSLVALGRGGESTPESCTATLTPPPVSSLACSADAAGAAQATWVIDPGLRTLDGIRVALDGSALPLQPPAATSVSLGKPAVGQHTVRVAAVWGPWDSPPSSCTFTVAEQGETLFIRGDANADTLLDIADPISILYYLFLSLPLTCVAAADGNGDGSQDLTDAVYMLSYLFQEGSPPPAPFPGCGVEPLSSCASFPLCN